MASEIRINKTPADPLENRLLELLRRRGIVGEAAQRAIEMIRDTSANAILSLGQILRIVRNF